MSAYAAPMTTLNLTNQTILPQSKTEKGQIILGQLSNQISLQVSSLPSSLRARHGLILVHEKLKQMATGTTHLPVASLYIATHHDPTIQSN